MLKILMKWFIFFWLMIMASTPLTIFLLYIGIKIMAKPGSSAAASTLDLEKNLIAALQRGLLEVEPKWVVIAVAIIIGSIIIAATIVYVFVKRKVTLRAELQHQE